MSFITYIIENSDLLLGRTLEHVMLAGIAVLLACSIGVPVGFLIANNAKLAKNVMNVANVIQTIPSLALFAFAIPLHSFKV